MNSCLADLSHLIPSNYLKKGRGRIEKTEIVEMAVMAAPAARPVLNQQRPRMAAVAVNQAAIGNVHKKPSLSKMVLANVWRKAYIFWWKKSIFLQKTRYALDWLII